MNATPLAIDAVPSVAISDGTFSSVTSTPLSSPATSPVARPAAIATGHAMPLEIRKPITTADRLQTLAKDRSSSDVISAKVNPKPSTDRKLTCFRTLSRLACEAKLSAKISRKTKSTIPAAKVP